MAKRKLGFLEYPGAIASAGEHEHQFVDSMGQLAAATNAFAAIGPDSTIPTTPLTLTPLQPGWQLVSALTWKASISYTANGRNDQVSFSGMSDVWSPIQIDFQGNVQGGVISLSISAPVRDVVTGKQDTVQWSGHSSIIGTYPLSPTAVRQRLGDLVLQVVAYVETWPGRRFQQFNPDGSPYFGAPAGFGVMQLDKAPVTARQIWDWMQNVDEGKGRFQAGQGTVVQHYKNVISVTPSLPPLSADMLLRASYTMYNGGPGEQQAGYYYTPKADNKGWQRNPNPSGNPKLADALDYADRAMVVLGQVQSGLPPSDWG